MTNLETNFLEVLTREAVRVCGRAVHVHRRPNSLSDNQDVTLVL